MPKIPRYSGQRSAGRGDTYATRKIDTRVGQAVSGLGQQISRSAQVLDQLQQQNQKAERSRKKTETQLKLQETYNNAIVAHNEDRDLDNKDWHFENLRSSLDDVVNGVDDAKVREEAKFIADSFYNTGFVNFSKENFQREVNRSDDNLKASELMYIELAGNNVNASASMTAKASFELSLEENAKLRGTSNELVAAEKMRVNKEVEKKNISTTAAEDIDLAIAKTDISTTLSEKEKAETKKSLLKFKKAKEAEFKKAKDTAVKKNEDDTLARYLSGDKSVDQYSVVSDMNAGIISPKFAKTMVNMFNSSKKVDAFTKADVYVETQNSFNEIIEKGNKATLEEISAFRNNVVSKYSEGELSRSAMENVLSDTNEMLNAKLSGKVDELYKGQDQRGFFQKITDFSGKYSSKKDESSTRIHQELMVRLRNGEEPNEALQASMDTELNRIVGNNKYYPKEIVATNPNTGANMYSYDNGQTWSKEQRG